MYVYTCTCVYVYTHACVYVYVNVYIHACIYTLHLYIHACTLHARTFQVHNTLSVTVVLKHILLSASVSHALSFMLRYIQLYCDF